jgi:hypothetical protein
MSEFILEYWSLFKQPEVVAALIGLLGIFYMDRINRSRKNLRSALALANEHLENYKKYETVMIQHIQANHIFHVNNSHLGQKKHLRSLMRFAYGKTVDEMPLPTNASRQEELEKLYPDAEAWENVYSKGSNPKTNVVMHAAE